MQKNVVLKLNQVSVFWHCFYLEQSFFTPSVWLFIFKTLQQPNFWAHVGCLFLIFLQCPDCNTPEKRVQLPQPTTPPVRHSQLGFSCLTLTGLSVGTKCHIFNFCLQKIPVWRNGTPSDLLFNLFHCFVWVRHVSQTALLTSWRKRSDVTATFGEMPPN